MIHFVSKRLLSGTAVVLLIAAIGILLALQGWKVRPPIFDDLAYVRGAEKLIAYGQMPDRGNLTSYGSYSPPGPSWLMLPGVLLFKDPRLFEFIGSTGLYIGTLLGLFLLARIYFGIPCALLTVALYGFSELGLEVAGSLFARFPIQFFYVWMVYWTVRWVINQKPNYLAAAIITWAAGMYVYMEIAPAIFVLPAVWLFYRPPLKLQPLLLSGIVAAVIWYPYLRFESTRNFADLRSQILREKTVAANYKASWCDPTLVLQNLEETSGSLDSPMAMAASVTEATRSTIRAHIADVWSRLHVAAVGLFSNFWRAAQIPGNVIVLTILLASSLFIFTMSEIFNDAADRLLFWRVWISRLGAAMVCLGILANEFVIARYVSPDQTLEASTVSTLRWLQAGLVLGGGTLLMSRTRLAAVINRVVLVTPALGQNTRYDGKRINVLVLSLTVPWVILFLVVEPTRLDRLWWLWPIQIMFLAALVTFLPALLRTSSWLAWAGSGLLLLMLSANPLLLSRAYSWITQGWAGPDAAQVQALDYVASQLRAAGREQAAIGYQMVIWRFYATFNILDPAYKVGANLDLLLKYRNGIVNKDHCAEGISPKDDFRIVSTAPPASIDPYGKGYFVVRPETAFVLRQQFGPYQVFERHE